MKGGKPCLHGRPLPSRCGLPMSWDSAERSRVVVPWEQRHYREQAGDTLGRYEQRYPRQDFGFFLIAEMLDRFADREGENISAALLEVVDLSMCSSLSQAREPQLSLFNGAGFSRTAHHSWPSC